MLAMAGTPARAQSVRGNLRDAERGHAIAGARLLLLTEAGAPVDSTVSDATGRYRLAAPAAGSYVVYFAMAGWAGVPSEPVRLAAGATADFDFKVQLISNDALRQMGEIMKLEPRLQQTLPEICGEELRAWEAGMLVGRVRSRATGESVGGVRVTVAGAAGAAVRPAVSGTTGVYVLCNIAAGPAISIITTTSAGVTDTTAVEIRAGTTAWYDLFVSRPRR